jgi:hypothetical protein
MQFLPGSHHFSSLKMEAGGFSEPTKHRGFTYQKRNLHGDGHGNPRNRVPASYRAEATQCQGDPATTIHTAVTFTISN